MVAIGSAIFQVNDTRNNLANAFKVDKTDVLATESAGHLRKWQPVAWNVVEKINHSSHREELLFESTIPMSGELLR